mgnify:CR=1 FL=1
MKVLVAPDKFKGTLSAAEAAQAMAEGVLRVYPDAEVIGFDLCRDTAWKYDVANVMADPAFLPQMRRRLMATKTPQADNQSSPRRL